MKLEIKDRHENLNPTLAVSCKIFLFSMNYRKASTITQLISDSPCACKLFCHLDSQTKDWRHGGRSRNLEGSLVQTILCQKLLFLYQLTHNMTTDCTLNYEFSTWILQAQNMGRTCCVHIFFLFFFWHSDQLMYTTWSTHVA